MPGKTLTIPRLTIGWTGKLPAHGDFVDGGARGPLINLVRHWLDQNMRQANKNGVVREAFLTTPLTRITLDEGFWGSGPALLVISPSIDAVGRLFPFALLAERSANSFDGTDTHSILDRMELITLSALQSQDGRTFLNDITIDEIADSQATEPSEPGVSVQRDGETKFNWNSPPCQMLFTKVFDGIAQEPEQACNDMSIS